MHDPMVMVFDVRPLRLDVWHDEPGDHDSGTVCKGMGNSGISWHNLRWAWQHRDHLHYRWWPYLRVRRWLVDRCAECERRFFWKDQRFSYMGSDSTYHQQCMTLRRVRCQLDDATNYLRGAADRNARWRVERRLVDLDEVRS